MKIFQKQLGFSLIEIIISLSVFALTAAVIASMSVGGFNSLNRSSDQAMAEALAQESLEAVRSIAQGAWNELIYDQTVARSNGSEWVLGTEGETELINDFTRTIYFTDVCRDALDEVVECPGNYTDVNTKKVKVEVSWTNELGAEANVSRSSYIVNWDSKDWQQTDWSGGSNQVVWSDPTRFDYKDSNVKTSVAGEISLTTAATGECAGYTWHFLDGAEYNYDPTFIRVQDSLAQLRPIDEEVVGIVDTPLDTYEFDGDAGLDTDVVKVNDNIYAIAYRGKNNDGYVRTVEIGSNGVIYKPYIDSFEFDGKDGTTPSIIHISGDVYAIAYQGSKKDGYLVTVEIDSNGNITNYNLDSYEYNDGDSYEPVIEHVAGNVYVIIFRHVLTGGAMVTVSISDNGDIGGVVDSYVYSTWGNVNPTIKKVADGMFAVAHNDGSVGAEIFTIGIENNGNIQPMVDYYNYDNNQGYEPDIIQLSEGIFAVAYRGLDDDGYIKTMEIQANGSIITPSIDTLEYDLNHGYNPQIVYLQDNIYGVVYHDNSNYGYVTIFYMEEDGQIKGGVLDTYRFDINARSGYLSMTHVAGLVYAIAYDGPNNDGFISTIELAVLGNYPVDGPNIYPNSVYSPPTVDSWVKIEEIANKDGGEIYYQISGDNGLNWYYWDGTAWSLALNDGNYNTAEEINDHLWEWQAVGDSFVFKAFLISNGEQAVKLDAVTINCSNFQIETGMVTTDERWTRVSLANIYANPVIIAGYHENNNWRPASVRLDNVTSSFFDIALQNPNGRNLSSDDIYYLVIEEGVWEIDGVNIEARLYDTNTVGYDPNWYYDIELYNYDFTEAPIVMHQVMSYEDPEWITTYVSDSSSRYLPPGLNDFRIAMNGAEAYSSHNQETIGWVAVEANKTGVFEGVAFETYKTTNSIAGHDNGCYYSNYQNIYDSAPLVMSSQQTMTDIDGSWSVICGINDTAVGLHSEEDQYYNWERSHGNETHGFMAFAEAFSYSSVGDADAYQNNGDLVSSALDMGEQAKAIQSASWIEIMPTECPLCDVTMQIRSADTQGGLSTAEWSGPVGAGDSFINPDGQLADVNHNGDRWVQYQVTLQGDGDYTPTVRKIKVNYK